MQYFLARQPIFNQKMKVYGYELSFRESLDSLSTGVSKEDKKASRVINDSFFLIGPDVISGGKKIFLHFTRQLLVNEIATLFPKDLLTIQIGNGLKADEKIHNSCKKLKESGYSIVLENLAGNPDLFSLIPYASMIKVDYAKTGNDIKQSVVKEFQPKGVNFLMTNVETSRALNESLELGYQYFQGNFFRRPFVLAGREVPGYKLNYLQLLKEIHQPDVDLNQVEEIIKRDVSLSYKLLRLINSAAFGFLTEIKSIKQALVFLGLREIKKWVALVALSNLGNDKPEELVKNCLMRAKFCESIATLVGLNDHASELFLTGLFSMIDALIDQPLHASLEYLPLSKEIKVTLMGEESLFLPAYNLTINYENGYWNEISKQANQLQFDESKLPEIYVNALKWVEQIFELQKK